jgi:hypothetical protein
VLHVHHIVADRKIAKVRDESGRLGLRLPGQGTGGHVGFIRKVIGAEQHQVAVRETYAARNRALHNHRGAKISRQVTGFVISLLPPRCLGPAAQPVGLGVLPQHAGEPLHLAVIRSHQQHACFLLPEGFDLL